MRVSAYCDGSCALKSADRWMGMGAFLILEFEPTGGAMMRFPITGPSGSHNEAEYLAVISTLEMILDTNKHFTSIEIHSDSQLIIRQIIGRYNVKKKRLIPYYTIVKELEKLITQKHGVAPVFTWVPREHPDQKVADKLSNIANPYYGKDRFHGGNEKDGARRPTVYKLDEVLGNRRFKYLHRKLKWGPISGFPADAGVHEPE